MLVRLACIAVTHAFTALRLIWACRECHPPWLRVVLAACGIMIGCTAASGLPLDDECFSRAPTAADERDWVALSPRVRSVLERRHHASPASAELTDRSVGFVSDRPDGCPLHPEWVLNHCHDLTDQAGVPAAPSTTCDTSQSPPPSAKTSACGPSPRPRATPPSPPRRTSRPPHPTHRPPGRRRHRRRPQPRGTTPRPHHDHRSARSLTTPQHRPGPRHGYGHPTTTKGKGRSCLPAETASDLQKHGRDDRI